MTVVGTEVSSEAGTRAALRAVREMIARAHSLGSADNDEGVLEQAASIAREVLGYKDCAVALRQGDGSFHCRLKPRLGPDGRNAETAISAEAYEELCQAAESLEGGALWLPREAAPPPHDLVLCGASGMLWAPVDGEGGGHAAFISPCSEEDTASPPGGLEAFLLGALAGLAGLGLELSRIDAARRRAASVTEAQRRQLEDLISASLEVRGEAALENVLSGVVRAMASGVGFARAAVWLTGQSPGRGPARLGPGFSPRQDASLEEVPVHLAATVGLSASEAGLLSAGWTSLAMFAPIMRPDMRLSRSYLWDHRSCEYPAELRDKFLPGPPNPSWADGTWHSNDSLTVPLEDREGNLLGVISMDEPLNGALPTREDCRSLEFFADQCALAVVEARRLEAALEEATTDELTGLANRRALLERGPLIVREGSACSALYIDIDHFKDVNDSFGHALGDEVIRAVGRIIAHRLRRGDLIARYGGEEFIVLLPFTHLEEATFLAEEIRRLVESSEPITVHPPLQLHVSIGVAAARPGDDTQSLLGAADTALYQAKRSGRNRICVAPA